MAHRPRTPAPTEAAGSRSFTGEVADLIADITRDQVPAEVGRAAQRAVLDTVGVMLAGVGEDVSRQVRKIAISPNPRSPCTVVGTRLRASATDAALANGTAAHALDFDDTQDNVRGHPSAPIVSAALAVAELRHSTGAQLVTSYAVGLEVAGKVGRSLGRSHATAGFHSTSTVGVLGAAAAAAHLMGLDAPRASAALGIAASGASGLRRSFGTMTKPLHAGDAARRGVLAALLAGQEFSSAPSVFDGPGSFVEIFSPAGDGRLDLLADLTSPWEAVVPGIAVKKYPCCNRGHRALDAILALRGRLGITGADEVSAVRVKLPSGQVDARGRVGPMIYPRPRTGLEAKFSMQYVVAAALTDGGLRIDSFTDAAVARPEVRELMSRVRPVADPARATGGPHDFVEVEVQLADGRTDSESVWFPRGDPRGGVLLGDDEMAAKFRDCATGVLAPQQVEQVLLAVDGLDALDDVATLVGLLSLDKF
jgi:2-methylcitrate dehydratase PrpD